MKKLVILLITCSSFYTVIARTQQPLLTPPQLISVLVDLALTQVMIDQDILDNSALAQSIFQEQAALIFNAHATNQEIFQQSYFHYLTDPKQFKLLQEQLISQLEKLLKEAEEKK